VLTIISINWFLKILKG